MKRNIMILGDGGHGKDTAARLYCDMTPGTSFESSSKFCANLFIFEVLRKRYGYSTVEECFNDRRNRRAEWHNLIAAFNTPMPTRLARAVYAEHDVYVGMRAKRELQGCFNQNLIDVVYWIDAFPRVPRESRASMDIDFHWVLHNRGRTCPLILIDNSSDKRVMFETEIYEGVRSGNRAR